MSQPQPEFEKLSFRIGLSGTYWDRKPEFAILINDTIVTGGTITEPSDCVQYINFSYTVIENTSYKLQIRLNNKDGSDTIQNADRTKILKDMLLNINSIEIDDIDLGQLIWSNSEFIGDDDSRPILKGCVNLGWNGAFTLTFTSPFYLWLLENM